MLELDKTVVLDCETYPNYFLIAFKSLQSKQVLNIEVIGSGAVLSDTQKVQVKRILANRVILTFNGDRFDMPIIYYAVKGATASNIAKAASMIITQNMPRFMSLKKLNVRPLQTHRHFDLMAMAPAVKTSLKTYGARLGSKLLQELPIPPGTHLTETQIDLIRTYCENDLDVTTDLSSAVQDRISLRETMHSLYGVNVDCRSEAQMAELILKNVLESKLGRKIVRPTYPSSYQFDYKSPDWFTPTSTQLKDLKDKVNTLSYGLAPSGSVKLPPAMTGAKGKFKLGYSSYSIGVGGLHSCEKSRTIETQDGWHLYDRDIESYYPNILLSLDMFPPQLGSKFADVYRSFLETRLKAKANNDSELNDALKVVLNGTFGKLGSKYSILYSPQLLTFVTLTGQLGLLLLIERLESGGFSVVSANTDGVVTLVHDDEYERYDLICKQWETQTKFKLDETEYKSLYSRSVNDYIAVKPDGMTKLKGSFGPPTLRVNPHRNICVTAVVNFVVNNVPLIDTINADSLRENFYDYVTVKTVTGGASYEGKYLGRTVRFVYTKKGKDLRCVKNNNLVPMSSGAEPVMDLVEVEKYDIDLDKYIQESHKILCELGYFDI